MKLKLILALLFVLGVASAFGQTKTSFFRDLTGYLGASTQQLEAFDNPEEKVMVYTKDTIIYSKFGTKTYKYQKEVWISSNDGQSVETYNYLASRGHRAAWELLLLYVYILLSYYMIGRYKKLEKNEDVMIMLIFGIMFGLVLLIGLFIAIGSGFSLGIVLVLSH